MSNDGPANILILFRKFTEPFAAVYAKCAQLGDIDVLDCAALTLSLRTQATLIASRRLALPKIPDIYKHFQTFFKKKKKKTFPNVPKHSTAIRNQPRKRVE
jgi:hypothetical protein